MPKKKQQQKLNTFLHITDVLHISHVNNSFQMIIYVYFQSVFFQSVFSKLYFPKMYFSKEYFSEVYFFKVYFINSHIKPLPSLSESLQINLSMSIGSCWDQKIMNLQFYKMLIVFILRPFKEDFD